ncbi:N-formylglutamate amidohydrolase [Hydrogenophaga sp.]|uniref:N-formylglutamate amidohydrolase n=1 Tax=Hydrogenophaga sp. TaxID=1904254 RepID=UPI00260C309B|nr:N-formylglutamate amidohydrolase [Hydrogenophaga sp.]MDM7949382.1 N-formylglutamate amidohydrolase [Hydrogenophaga sp.]
MPASPVAQTPPDPSSVLHIHGPTSSRVPVVLDSPHSGQVRPPDFGCILSDEDLRDAQDTHIDTLYNPATELGVSLLAAQYPRTYIDANRHEGDVDLTLLDAPWPDLYQPSGKAALGKALAWRTLDDGRPLYAAPLTVQAMRWRIAHYHRPYHAALKQLLDAAYDQFGCVYHINCHSMNPVSGLMGEGGPGALRADFVLGDRDGTTCSGAFTAFVQQALAAHGYGVAINKPYKGVELVRAYADPGRGRHSLQLEINKRVYMDMASGQPNDHFPVLQQRLRQLIADITLHFPPERKP